MGERGNRSSTSGTLFPFHCESIVFSSLPRSTPTCNATPLASHAAHLSSPPSCWPAGSVLEWRAASLPVTPSAGSCCTPPSPPAGGHCLCLSQCVLQRQWLSQHFPLLELLPPGQPQWQQHALPLCCCLCLCQRSSLQQRQPPGQWQWQWQPEPQRQQRWQWHSVPHQQSHPLPQPLCLLQWGQGQWQRQWAGQCLRQRQWGRQPQPQLCPQPLCQPLLPQRHCEWHCCSQWQCSRQRQWPGRWQQRLCQPLHHSQPQQ